MKEDIWHHEEHETEKRKKKKKPTIHDLIWNKITKELRIGER